MQPPWNLFSWLGSAFKIILGNNLESGSKGRKNIWDCSMVTFWFLWASIGSLTFCKLYPGLSTMCCWWAWYHLSLFLSVHIFYILTCPTKGLFSFTLIYFLSSLKEEEHFYTLLCCSWKPSGRVLDTLCLNQRTTKYNPWNTSDSCYSFVWCVSWEWFLHF